jgi:hypothetical protein
VTPAETAEWIINADFDTLERRVNGFSDHDKLHLLTWALKVQRDPTITSEAGIRWAVAVIGTLAPEKFDDENEVLEAEVVG